MAEVMNPDFSSQGVHHGTRYLALDAWSTDSGHHLARLPSSLDSAEERVVTQVQQTKNLVEARQGETKGHMRLVLAASTGLAILALGAVYLWFMNGH